jgi:hypothetical protein
MFGQIFKFKEFGFCSFKYIVWAELLATKYCKACLKAGEPMDLMTDGTEFRFYN